MRPLALALLLGVAAAAQQPKQPAAKTVRKHHTPARHPAAPAGIAPARARQIQEALVKAGYLERASGNWDDATRAAMEKFQRDHRWQVRFVPDARALIALGLGPHLDALPTAAAAGPPR